MKRYKLLAVMLAVAALAAGCGQEERSGRETQTEETGGAGSSEQAGQTEPAEEAADMTDGETVTNASLPEELAQIPREYIDLVKKTVEETMKFKEIHVTKASCTISCHCGPNTLGILFETK